MTTDTKKLAEFAAEFLGFTKTSYTAPAGHRVCIWDYPRDSYGPTTAIGEPLNERSSLGG